MYNPSSLRKTMMSSYLPCLLFKTVTCTAFFDLLVSAKSKIYILFIPSHRLGKHDDKYSQLPLPWWVLTLVEATASCTLSIMNSLVIRREGSSLKRELIRATLAASRLASALLKQHLRREGEKESLKNLASHHFAPTQWVSGHLFLFIRSLSASILP